MTHYPRCAKAMGYAAAKASDRASAQTMKATPTNDPLLGEGTIRADGRKLHPMYLFQVKSPAESKYPSDSYKLLRTAPPEQAFRPLPEHTCPMLPA